MAGPAQRTTARKASGKRARHSHNKAGARATVLPLSARDRRFANSRNDVFASWRFGEDTMDLSYYPDQTGMNLTVTHNWIDGSYRPLSRAWRTKVLRQLGFRVIRWERTDWGEQALFAKD